MWLLWSVAAFSCGVNVLMLTGPIYMLQVYDRVLGSGSQETLVALSVLVLFLFLVMGTLDYVRGRVGARFGARLQNALEDRVFRSAMARARRTGEMQPALQDLASVQRLSASPVFMAVFDLPWTPLFIAAIFIFHPWLGGLAVLGAVLLIAITALNQTLSRDPLSRANAAGQHADRMAGEMQREAELIRSLGMTGSAFDRWHRLRAGALDEGMRASDLVGGFASMTRTTRLFLQSAILGLGAFLVLRGEMTAGAMIAGSILLGRALAPIELAIGQWQMIADAKMGWGRLGALLQQERPEPPRMGLPRPKAHLDITQLSVAPPGGTRPVLRGVTLSVEPGHALGVIGPSGSGKSTLARAVTGVWLPSAGQIRLDGASLDQFDPDVLGQLIGYLPQNVTLFDGTIAENIARLEGQFDGERVVEAAKRAAAHDLILNLPQGYDTRVTGASARLSGGQIQRIGLARALYSDPVLLVLDEPNSALDNEGSEAMNRAVQDLKARGCSVLIMAHRPSAIKECETLLVLKDGVPVGYGPTADVLQKTLKNYAELRNAAGRGGGVS
jgi:ATP-binding cassette subfamily C protein